MPNVKIELSYVNCLDPEDSDRDGDEFFLIGAFVTKDTVNPVLTAPIQIKRKEKKTFDPTQAILFDANVPVDEKIKGVLIAFDEEAGKKDVKAFSKHQEIVDGIKAAVASAASDAQGGIQTSAILSQVISAADPFMNLGKDDRLGSEEVEIDPQGDATEEQQWRIRGSKGLYANWSYVVAYQITRS